jgi:HlyD family secretion protein
VTEVGGRVRRGDVLARVADLSSFRVEATFSDVNASRLVAGIPARVRVSGGTLEGSLARVLPTVHNGAVTAVVTLERGASPELRPNLRVDVDLVLDRRASTLRLAKGSYVAGEGTVRVFVVRGDRARRVDVKLGATGVERHEVLSGLSEGDEVIVSDMSRLAHLEEVRVR